MALIKGSPNPEGAKKLIDYLLRPESEARLAEFGGFQIPLNPNVSAKLPPALFAWIDEFIRAHYRPEEKKKKGKIKPPSFKGAKRDGI